MYTLSFPSGAGGCTMQQVENCLRERGESYAPGNDGELALRSLPLSLRIAPDTGVLNAQAEVTSAVPLARMIDVLFDLSVQVGGDVVLDNAGAVRRADLWVLWSDEQDRVRLGAALQRASEHSNSDEVHRRMWAILSALNENGDVRWDAKNMRVVRVGDVVPGRSAVAGNIHSLLWRWLSETYPGIAEAEHTIL